MADESLTVQNLTDAELQEQIRLLQQQLSQLRSEQGRRQQEKQKQKKEKQKQKQQQKQQKKKANAQQYKIKQYKAKLQTKTAAEKEKINQKRSSNSIESAKMTKHDYMLMYRKQDISQFISRCAEILDISNDLDMQMLSEIRDHMEAMDINKLTKLMQAAGLRTTYFESDASWNPQELNAWTIGTLYDFIMSY